MELVHEGKGELLMKGSLHTDELMRAVTASKTGLRTERRISHVFIMDVPTYSETLFITDAAINIFPDLDAKRDIIQNAIDLFTKVGLGTPRVAILSAVETVTSKIPSTIEAAALCKMADRKQITGGILDGPLAFDNAIDPEAARIKGIESPVAGKAQILVVPDLEAGNMLAKNLIFLSKADSAGLVLGARVPVVLTSRADSVRSRMASCAAAVLYAAARREVAKRKPQCSRLWTRFLSSMPARRALSFRYSTISRSATIRNASSKGRSTGLERSRACAPRTATERSWSTKSTNRRRSPTSAPRSRRPGTGCATAKLSISSPSATVSCMAAPTTIGRFCVDRNVLARLEQYCPLAPLHQPNNLAPIRTLLDRSPDLPQVACFDTAFHRSHGPLADRYAIPETFYREGVRRYGFHGLSYEYVAGPPARGRPGDCRQTDHCCPSRQRCVDVRACRWQKRREHHGLYRPRRSADGHPARTNRSRRVALPDHHKGNERLGAVESFLYRECGLKGLSGISNDLRENC